MCEGSAPDLNLSEDWSSCEQGVNFGQEHPLLHLAGVCASLCGSPTQHWGVYVNARLFKLYGFTLGHVLTPLLTSYSQHWYPDHRTRWSRRLYTGRASPDTQILLSHTQHSWGKAVPTPHLVHLQGSWLRTLAKVLALSGPLCIV